MTIDRLEDDGAPVLPSLTWDEVGDEIVGHGFEQSLTSIRAAQVPREGRNLWALAQRTAATLRALEWQLADFMDVS